MEEKVLPPLLYQISLTKLGMYCSERLSIDLYYVIEFINLNLPHFNISELEKEYDGKYGSGKFKDVMIKLKKITRLVSESKTFYDALSDKALIKKSIIIKQGQDNVDNIVQKSIKRYFNRTASRINLINQEVYNLFIFLIMHSSVQRGQIKQEYFKNLEQKDNRRLTLDKRDRKMGGGF